MLFLTELRLLFLTELRLPRFTELRLPRFLDTAPFVPPPLSSAALLLSRRGGGFGGGRSFPSPISGCFLFLEAREGLEAVRLAGVAAVDGLGALEAERGL